MQWVDIGAIAEKEKQKRLAQEEESDDYGEEVEDKSDEKREDKSAKDASDEIDSSFDRKIKEFKKK